MSTFFKLKKAFFEREHKKRIQKYTNAYAINQGFRGAEPPDAGKFLKKQFISWTRNFLFLGVPVAKFLEKFLFLL